MITANITYLTFHSKDFSCFFPERVYVLKNMRADELFFIFIGIGSVVYIVAKDTE